MYAVLHPAELAHEATGRTCVPRRAYRMWRVRRRLVASRRGLLLVLSRKKIVDESYTLHSKKNKSLKEF